MKLQIELRIFAEILLLSQELMEEKKNCIAFSGDDTNASLVDRSQQRCNVHSKSKKGLNNSKEGADGSSQTPLSATQSTPNVVLLMSVSWNGSLTSASIGFKLGNSRTWVILLAFSVQFTPI